MQPCWNTPAGAAAPPGSMAGQAQVPPSQPLPPMQQQQHQQQQPQQTNFEESLMTNGGMVVVSQPSTPNASVPSNCNIIGGTGNRRLVTSPMGVPPSMTSAVSMSGGIYGPRFVPAQPPIYHHAPSGPSCLPQSNVSCFHLFMSCFGFFYPPFNSYWNSLSCNITFAGAAYWHWIILFA